MSEAARFHTDALMQSVFRDHYALDAEKLESLYSKSKRHQWNAELDVAWDDFDPASDVLDRARDLMSRLRCVAALPDDVQTKLFREAATFTMSQVLHGEQAALMVCGQLVSMVPELDGKFAAAVQVMDEARHVAYGVLSLEARIPNLPEPARRKLEDLAYDSVLRIAGRGGKPSFTTQFSALAAAGVDAGAFLPKLLKEVMDPAVLDLDGLEDPMTRTVLPNLMRVGLIPERLRLGYLAQGWRVDPSSGAIEDIHTWHPDTLAVRAELQAQGKSIARPD